jgi:hypothetical protein
MPSQVLTTCEASVDSSDALGRVAHHRRGEHIVAAHSLVLHRPNRVAAAYRRLALVILGLDVSTLADALRIDPAVGRR